MDSICRLCGTNTSKLFPIFGFNNGRLVSDLIILIIPICLRNDEHKNLPKNICEQCLEVIEKIHNLRKKSIENDKLFRSSEFQNDMIKNELESLTQNFMEESNSNADDINDNVSIFSYSGENNEEPPASDNNENNCVLLVSNENSKEASKAESFKCEFCEEMFKFESNLASHCRDHHQNINHKYKYNIKSADCKICGLHFPFNSNLKPHIIQYHDRNLKYGCPQCTYRFKKLVSLQNHGLKVHNIEEMLPSRKKPSDTLPEIPVCDFCGIKQIGKDEMFKHIQRRHLKVRTAKALGQITDHRCEYCNKKFAARGNMLKHIDTIHMNILPHKCEQCNNQGFRTKHLYAKHLEKVHSVDDLTNVLGTTSRVPINSEPLICEFCSENCGYSNYQFERHILFLHENQLKEIYNCNLCSKKFIFKNSLSKHLAWHDRKKIEQSYEFNCDMCTKSFLNAQRLERHKTRYHASGSSLVCHVCGRQMQNKASLRLHIKRHSEKRQFPCPQCPQSFVYTLELEKHMASHTNERKYVCDFEGCTKSFNDLYVFQKHKKRHAGLERNHHCQFCEKKFVNKYSLDRHILTHTHQKPHACEYCPMAYAQKNDLIKHLSTHVGNCIYKCEFEGCNEGFRLKHELKQHYAVHYKK